MGSESVPKERCEKQDIRFYMNFIQDDVKNFSFFTKQIYQTIKPTSRSLRQNTLDEPLGQLHHRSKPKDSLVHSLIHSTVSIFEYLPLVGRSSIKKFLSSQDILNRSTERKERNDEKLEKLKKKKLNCLVQKTVY